MVWPVLAANAGSIIGGLFSAFGAHRQNSAAEDIANAQMDFQREQNQKQMDFQERMSSSAHQREVRDLLAAGLNPMLSAMGGSGSSSPSGATSAGASAPVVNEAGAGVSSAVSAMQLQNMKAQKLLLDAQAANQNAQADLTRASTPIPSAVGDTVSGFRQFLENSGLSIPGVLGGARGAVTNMLEGGDNLAISGQDLVRRAVEGFKHSAQSGGNAAGGVIDRLEVLIRKGNEAYKKRLKDKP